MKAEPLNPEARTRALDEFAGTVEGEPLDVLVVGGGVVGAAAAFDAATRGLRVGLVEAQDLGQGTSSRSSKLVHGGLRYLQMMDFKLVAEALRERDLLLKRTAPHLVRSLPFVFPFKTPLVDRAFIGSGVSLYDAMSVRPGEKRAVPFHKHLSRSRLRRRFAGLDHDTFVGALEYFDAQVDDARLVMTLARSAQSLGAAVATRTAVESYVHDDAAAAGADTGESPVVGARLRDLETGRSLEVRAKETIIAAGVWTEQQQDASEADAGLKVLASKGIHITVPKDRIAAEDHVGVISQTEKSVLFLIPQEDCWAIGTTDTAWHENVDVPAPTSADIDYVLEHANAILQTDLTREDIIGTWAGLRPLLQPEEKGDGGGSAKVSREHTVKRLAPGLTAVAGGKLTTYRVMAEDAVDFAAQDRFSHRQSLTEVMPLLGGQGYGEWAGRAEEIAAERGLGVARVRRLLRRYGSLLGDVLAPAEEQPDLLEPLEHAPGYLRAEIRYAAEQEGAVHLEDLLERRTRIVHEVRDRGLAAMDEVIALVAGPLGWDEERQEHERRSWTSRVEALLAAEKSGSDAEAAALLADTIPATQTRWGSWGASEPTGRAD